MEAIAFLMHFFLLQVNLKMREITEKEVKLKQQLLESPAHQKVKGTFILECIWLMLLPVLKNCVSVHYLLVLYLHSLRAERGSEVFWQTGSARASVVGVPVRSSFLPGGGWSCISRGR